jgi:hypothetical protein
MGQVGGSQGPPVEDQIGGRRSGETPLETPFAPDPPQRLGPGLSAVIRPDGLTCGISGGAGRPRTCDRRIMSPLL